MGSLTRGYIRFALHIKGSDSLYYSVSGDGCCNLCELELSDTYESEEAALLAMQSLKDNIKNYFVITKVVYEFRPYKKSAHWNNEYDDAKYIVK